MKTFLSELKLIYINFFHACSILDERNVSATCSLAWRLEHFCYTWWILWKHNHEISFFHSVVYSDTYAIISTSQRTTDTCNVLHTERSSIWISLRGYCTSKKSIRMERSKCCGLVGVPTIKPCEKNELWKRWKFKILIYILNTFPAFLFPYLSSTL